MKHVSLRLFHSKRNVLRWNDFRHNNFLTQMLGVFSTNLLMHWKYAKYRSVLLFYWLLVCYTIFIPQTPWKGEVFWGENIIFLTKRPDISCKLGRKVMCIGTQDHGHWTSNACRLPICSVWMGLKRMISGFWTPKTFSYFLYFSILFCQIKRTDVTNKRFINTFEYRWRIFSHHPTHGRQSFFIPNNPCLFKYVIFSLSQPTTFHK